MIGQGPYSIWSDIIGCIMWPTMTFAASGGVVAVAWFLLGVIAGVLI